jgi:hypothetical protein
MLTSEAARPSVLTSGSRRPERAEMPLNLDNFHAALARDDRGVGEPHE